MSARKQTGLLRGIRPGKPFTKKASMVVESRCKTPQRKISQDTINTAALSIATAIEAWEIKYLTKETSKHV